MIDHIIGLNCVIRGISIDAEPVYDLAFQLNDEVPAFRLEANCIADRAISPIANIQTIGMGILPYVSAAFGGSLEISSFYLDVDLKKAIAEQFTMTIPGDFIGMDVALSADREISPMTGMVPTLWMQIRPDADCLLSFQDAIAPTFSLDVQYLMRSTLTIPPSGLLKILGTAVDEQGERLLHGATLPRGNTHILILEAEGTRLDAYLIEFKASLKADLSEPVIYKSSSPLQGGGVKVQAIAALGAEELYSSTTRQRMTAQIVLEPKDLMALERTTTLFYEVRMSQEGMGESYRLNPEGKIESFIVSVE